VNVVVVKSSYGFLANTRTSPEAKKKIPLLGATEVTENIYLKLIGVPGAAGKIIRGKIDQISK